MYYIHTYIYQWVCLRWVVSFSMDWRTHCISLWRSYFYASISHVNFRSLPGGDIWNWVDHFDRSVVSFEFIGLLDYWIIGTIWYYIIYRTFTILKLYTGLLDWSWVTFQKKHKKSNMSDVRCETWSMVNVITRPRIKSTRYYQDTFVARWPSGVSTTWIFTCCWTTSDHYLHGIPTKCLVLATPNTPKWLVTI
jgi:hypothetical protein